MTHAPPPGPAPTQTGSPLFPFRFNGAQLVAHVSGALLWPEKGALVVSDLHLEKGADFARTGTFLPPYDSDETLNRLDDLLTTTKARTLISLGDSFHSPSVIAGLSDALLSRIQHLTNSVERFIWVTGNHDPEVPAHFGGEVHEDFALGALHFRHEASPLFALPGEVSGHWHPKASIRGPNNRPLTRSCFIHDSTRLILPAFGTFTGGLNVAHPSIRSLFSHNSGDSGTGLTKCAVYLLGKRQVAAVRGDSLLR
ncbi:MAG: ligase-associated DNA damage response endonuclease PdeM [Alphaproteobacteria bacterium]